MEQLNNVLLTVIYLVLNTPDNPSPELPWSSYLFIYFSEIFNQCLNENGELVSGARQLGMASCPASGHPFPM